MGILEKDCSTRILKPLHEEENVYLYADRSSGEVKGFAILGPENIPSRKERFILREIDDASFTDLNLDHVNKRIIQIQDKGDTLIQNPNEISKQIRLREIEEELLYGLKISDSSTAVTSSYPTYCISNEEIMEELLFGLKTKRSKTLCLSERLYKINQNSRNILKKSNFKTNVGAPIHMQRSSSKYKQSSGRKDMNQNKKYDGFENQVPRRTARIYNKEELPRFKHENLLDGRSRRDAMNQKSKNSTAVKSNIKLPMNWRSLNVEEMVCSLTSKNNDMPNEAISTIKDRYLSLKEKSIKSSPTQVNTGIKLPSNWKMLNPVDIIEKIRKENSSVSEEILQDINQNLEQVNLHTKNGRKKHDGYSVQLPSNWRNSEDLCESLKNGNIPISAETLQQIKRNLENQKREVQERMQALKQRKSINHEIKSRSVFKLPSNWKESNVDDITKKIKDMNPNAPTNLLQDVTAKLEKLSTYENTPNASDGIKLPSNWKEMSVDELVGLYEGENRSQLANAISKNAEVASQKENVKHKHQQYVKLPSNWNQLAPEELSTRIREIIPNSSKCSVVLENIKNSASRKSKSTEKNKHYPTTKRGRKPKACVAASYRTHKRNNPVSKKSKKIRPKEQSVKTKDARRGRKSKSMDELLYENLSEEERVKLLKPSLYGWRREVRLGVQGATLLPTGTYVDERIRIDISYIPPPKDGKRLKFNKQVKVSLKELKSRGVYRISNPEKLQRYLSANCPSLNSKNFSYKRKILKLDNFEVVVKSNEAKELMNRRSSILETNNPKEIRTTKRVDNNVNMKDLFGDISDSDLSDSTNDRVKSPERLNQQNSNDDTKIKNDQVLDQEVTRSDKVSEDDALIAKKTKKIKERVKLVISCSDFYRSLSVKPDRSIRHILDGLENAQKLGIDKYEIYCGVKLLTGEEKVCELDESKIVLKWTDDAINYKF